MTWLKALFQWVFTLGLRLTTEEAVATLVEQTNEARKRTLLSTLESIKFAADLPKGEHHAAEAIAIFKQGTVDQSRHVQQFLKGLR